MGRPRLFSPLESRLRRRFEDFRYRRTARGAELARQRKITYRRRHPTKAYEYNKRRRATDPIVRTVHYIRVRISQALRDCDGIKLGRSLRLLGCSATKYKQHIESLFLPGMSWENRHLWHIDHKRAICKFDLATLEGQQAAFHYTNTQPLWAVDNLRKGAKL